MVYNITKYFVTDLDKIIIIIIIYNIIIIIIYNVCIAPYNTIL